VQAFYSSNISFYYQKDTNINSLLQVFFCPADILRRESSYESDRGRANALQIGIFICLFEWRCRLARWWWERRPCSVQ